MKKSSYNINLLRRPQYLRRKNILCNGLNRKWWEGCTWQSKQCQDSTQRTENYLKIILKVSKFEKNTSQ